MHTFHWRESLVAVDGGVKATITYEPETKAQPESLALDVAYPITYYDSVTNPAQATAIVLGRGERAVADVGLQPVPALNVRINRDNSASTHSVVTLERPVLDGQPIQVDADRRGDSKGESIWGIPPGHYIMRSYAVGKPGNPVVPAAREIDINESGTLEDKDKGGSDIAVSAELHYDFEAPQQASLRLLNKKTRNDLYEQVGNKGDVVFKQEIVPGSYEISLVNAPGVYIKSITAAGARISGRTLEVAAGATVKLTISAAHGEGQVTGVALRDGRRFAGAMIVLVPADPAHNEMLFRRDQSASDGTFILHGVVPGAYTALAIEDGWELEWMNPEVLKNYMSAGVAVRVQPNGKYDIKVVVQ
jgi:hypothetical protein